MKYFVLLQALGDNLISLSFLEQIDEKIHILGTNYTKNIAKLMGAKNNFDIQLVFDDIPAFYDVKKQGVWAAIKDLYKFVEYIKNNNIQEIIFEKKDFRGFLISFLCKSKIYEPNNLTLKIYDNRKELIEKIYNQSISLNHYTLKIQNPKIIVINPLTRVELKNIKHHHLIYIIEELKKFDYEIYLIDIEKKYEEFENIVQYYLRYTTLDDVKKLIQRCDLYIGGDSFLIHLAYYLKRNYFVIFYRDNDDFLPPNIELDFYIKAHKNKNFDEDLKQKFINIGLIKI